MKQQRWEESEKRKDEERRSEKRNSQKKEDQGARKGKSRERLCFLNICFVAPEGGKVGASLKRRCGAIWSDEKSKHCTRLWREAHFEVKMHRTPQVRIAFGR
jgi:hypothetical protein